VAITIDDVKDIAKLARLNFQEDEISEFTEEISGILKYIEKLNELDVSGIEPTSHVVEMKNVLREDVVGESFSIEETLLNAPDKKDRFFVVPKVIDN